MPTVKSNFLTIYANFMCIIILCAKKQSRKSKKKEIKKNKKAHTN